MSHERMNLSSYDLKIILSWYRQLYEISRKHFLIFLENDSNILKCSPLDNR